MVSQPLVLPSVTTAHGAVHPVAIVARSPAVSRCVMVGCPAQARLTVLPVVPPLKASTCVRRSATSRVKVALVGPLRKETLLVVKAPYGPECHHWLLPQSITPGGYCPLSAWFSPARSSNVTISVPVLGAEL